MHRLRRIDRLAWQALERHLAKDKLFACAVAATLALAMGSWEFWHQSIGWHDIYSGDAHEYAGVAKRLAEGRGFTTPVLFPITLNEFGVGDDHPSLVRSPLWPMLQAGAFLVTGVRAETIHVLLCGLVLGTCGLVMVLAGSLAGRPAALFAGLAMATCDTFLLFAIDGLTEPLFALLLTLALALYARGAPAYLLGGVCALLYLTRDNGALLLPVFCALFLFERNRTRRIALCAAGFALVAGPWLLRNALVTGDPLYSLNRLAIYFAPEMRVNNTNVFFQLEMPERLDTSYPWRKFRQLLWQYVTQLPLLAANAVAFGGTLLGALRRDRTTFAWWALAGATMLLLAVALPFARYFAPLAPPMVALGAAAFSRWGGVLRLPLLALLVLAPLAPPPVAELGDLWILRSATTLARAGGTGIGTPAEVRAQATIRRRCLPGRPIVLATDAARIAWQTDAIAIHLPSSNRDFWRIVDGWDVQFLQLRRYPRVGHREILERFDPVPECGPEFYARRPAAETSR